MKELRPRATKALAVLLSPLLVAGSLLGAVPAQAQVKAVAPAEVTVLGLAPAAFGGVPSLSPSSLPSALTLSSPLSAPSMAPPSAPAPSPAALPVAAVPVALSPAPLPLAASRPAASAASPVSAVSTLAQAVSNGISRTIGRFFDGGRSATEDSTPAFAQGIIVAPFEANSLRPGVRLDPKPKRTDK
ncbi:MAG: hypothetical protein PHS14_06630, partial [Elusimicrobia bacterium]|nr:hypothetical protein [Elusimicrobiota bacterium]